MRTTKRKVFWAAALIVSGTFGSAVSMALDFRHTITGEDLKVLEKAPEEGRDTEAVKHFLESGENRYVEVPGCFPEGEEAYLVACSGCHGHHGEGKLGPGLGDAYWTYPKNKTDKGLFETIFGGAQGMMGPHGGHLTLDETLKLMAWIRHLYSGDPADAAWLNDEQKTNFTPFDPEKAKKTAEAKTDAGECKASAN